MHEWVVHDILDAIQVGIHINFLSKVQILSNLGHNNQSAQVFMHNPVTCKLITLHNFRVLSRIKVVQKFTNLRPGSVFLIPLEVSKILRC